MHGAEGRGQMAHDRRQMADDREQRAESKVIGYLLSVIREPI